MQKATQNGLEVPLKSPKRPSETFCKEQTIQSDESPMKSDVLCEFELFRAEQITLAVNSVSKSRSKPFRQSPHGMSFTESVMSCLPP